jgi:hypothetical protein
MVLVCRSSSARCGARVGQNKCGLRCLSQRKRATHGYDVRKPLRNPFRRVPVYLICSSRLDMSTSVSLAKVLAIQVEHPVRTSRWRNSTNAMPMDCPSLVCPPPHRPRSPADHHRVWLSPDCCPLLLGHVFLSIFFGLQSEACRCTGVTCGTSSKVLRAVICTTSTTGL